MTQTKSIPLVTKLGGWEAVRPVLARGGIQLTNRLKAAWLARGLSGKAIRCLAAEASQRGIHFVVSDFESNPKDTVSGASTHAGNAE